ncbi:SusC/RagA family TonB-linked outer membrane protein [Spirosoma utsteinense]|uniref:TonB-linked SusC/RagA family outer membrane protein n=1 Tax=Spirosoma utsteinense TaxID=2585773 RepID=A0ABR6WBW6_9BACT|nr:TonB-dependent receptor [Spirosoma utsteinense]MBC3786998.1 TonB-linked SusC/RagA family outer membrane protein [Spirosoma utsteinense]MBC3793421.1 TonB-linked SusC/RagA family outer membrane protein [Spirosoma utsteinense]
MKKLCQLLVLGTVAGCFPSFAQDTRTAPLHGSLSANGQLLAVHGQKLRLPSIIAQPADIAITGKVLDERGTGLPGVSVVVKGTTQGATTDGEGSFRISVPSANSVLVFSFVGYLRQEVTVGSQTALNVTLAPDDQTLNEVVVVGYGSQLKKEITGAVQTVSAQEIKDLPVSQIGQKLQGRLAGVQINQATGKPGQGISIRIRGQVSVTAGSDPLYVIDGFPITGNIAQLNPDEIEDISILKDAASTSLYGSRAANGVVLITTKKGKPGQTNISFSAFAGIQQVPMRGRVKMLDAVQFAQFKKEYYEDQLQPVPVEFQNPSQYEGKNNDWYDAVLREAPIQSYNLSISNNTAKSNTSLVAGIFNQDGVVLNNKYKRYSLRMNSNYNLSDRVTVGFNLAPSYVYDNTPRTDGDRGTGILFNALHTWPVMPIYDATGQLTKFNTFPGSTGNIFQYPNWVRAASELTNETKNTNLLANAYVQYRPIAGLNLRSTMNVEYVNSKFFYFNPSTATSAINVPIPTTASSIRQNLENVSWLNENLATYTRSFNDHNFELLAGFTNQWYRQEFSRIGTNTYSDDRLPTIQGALNIDRAGNPSATRNDINQWTLTSYLSRLTYNYKGKYLFTAAVRTDGSSRFGANNQYGTFPSASVGWVLTDENFLKPIQAVSFAKVRASYGIIGNNNIGNYTSYALVNNTTNAVFGSTVATGSVVTSLANPNLGWETTRQFDMGLDLGLFNDRIQFIYDFYTKRTTNLLYAVQIPQESGFTNFNDNIGEIKFWGHEFSLTTKNAIGKLKWTTNANISFNRNQVVALAPGIDRVYGGTGFHITQVGQPFGQFYGLVKEGYYQTAEELRTSPIIPGRSAIGTIKFKDINGDGIITNGGDADDRAIIGSPFPKFIYGITNDLKYGNFDFSITGSGSYGNQLWVRHLYSTANLDAVFNMVEGVKDRFRVQNTVVNGVGVASTIITPGNGQFGATNNGGNYTGIERDWHSTQFLANASFFTIKNITLGYNIGAVNKLFKSARVYASAQQVYIFTKYTGGPNPETSGNGAGDGPGDNLSQGVDFSNYPVPRTFTLGVNLNF